MTRAAAVLAVFMVLVVGTCLLDGGERPGHDLCLTCLTLTRGSDLGSLLDPGGALPPEAIRSASLFRADQPVPPPRS